MFWAGAFFGASITYFIFEIRSAFRSDPHDKIYRCAMEAARQSALHDLDNIPDDKLITAIANGINPSTLSKN